MGFENCFLRFERSTLRKFFLFLNLYWEFSKLHSKCPEKILKTFCFSERVVKFFIIFRQWAGTFFGSSGKNSSVELSKLPSTCPEEFFWEKLFSEKIKCIIPYSNTEWRLFGLLAKFSGWALENCLHVSIRTFWGKWFVFQILFNHLRHWAKKFCSFVKTFGRDAKPHSSCRYELFVEVVSKKVIWLFFQIRTMSEELSSFCRSFSDGVAKNAFYVTLATISVDMIFLDKCFFRHFRKLIEIISATFWASAGPAVVTAFYNSRETLWGRGIFLRNFIFVNILGHWTKSFRPSGKDFLAGSSKLHSTCPEEHFGVFFENVSCC